ncbi:tetratricopeptide repeat protein GNN isoform 2 [Camelus ferus]|nr:tetratricopeptide repeat protein GNN isoform 2 [Camelus ferus]
MNSCFPFFIYLLGQTYGDFVPDYSPVLFSEATDLSTLSIVEQNLYVAAKNSYPWVLENANCSLMELEVIQAAFLNEPQFQYFYFKTEIMLLKTLDEEKEEIISSGFLTNDELKLKMGKLKAKIISKGLPVRFYRDLHELDYKHNFERFYHEEFTEKYEEVFVISKESNRTFAILERFALKDVKFDVNNTAAGSRINPLPTYKSILLLSGERGCGKSTLIASWVSYFRKKHLNMMIPHFVGSTCESSDIMSMIHYFTTELQSRNYGTQLETGILDEDSNVLAFSLLVEVFITSSSLKPCILALDETEELVGIYGISGQKARDFWLPGSLSPRCKFIMGTISSSRSYKLLCARPDVRMVELVSTGDEEELWELILKRWIEDYSWTFKQKKANSDTVALEEGLDSWVADTVCLLSASLCRLAE